jgi:hypothetical protein
MDRDRFSFIVSLRLLLVLALAMLGGACNKSTVKLYPVKGKVLFKDQPASGAQIVFRPANEDPAAKLSAPYATVGEDGGFSLRTEPHGEGALPGDYIVMITWYGPDPKNAEQSVNKLPAKYADPNTPLLKVTVKEGINELEPFKLKP